MLGAVQVDPVGGPLDLSSAQGRLDAICSWISYCECWSPVFTWQHTWHLFYLQHFPGMDALAYCSCPLTCVVPSTIHLTPCAVHGLRLPYTDRIMALMSTQLPDLDRRLELWKVVQRGPAKVMLKPQGAIKTVSRIKSSGASGINQNILTQAYQVAAEAAAQQQRLGQPPFLVRATQGPKFSRSNLEVHTTPLGFSRPVRTEQVGACVGGL